MATWLWVCRSVTLIIMGASTDGPSSNDAITSSSLRYPNTSQVHLYTNSRIHSPGRGELAHSYRSFHLRKKRILARKFSYPSFAEADHRATREAAAHGAGGSLEFTYLLLFSMDADELLARQLQARAVGFMYC